MSDKSPSKKEIRDTRVGAGLTQHQSADMISSHIRTWQRYESGDSKMPPSKWQVFLDKVNKLKKRFKK